MISAPALQDQATAPPGGATTLARPKRIVTLDACRGLAAMAVLLFHYTSWYDVLFRHGKAEQFYLPWGRRGVDFFFLISGFVIFMTLLGVRDRREFFVKRFARLAPVYWTGVVLTSLVCLAGLPGRDVSFTDAALNLTLFESYFGIPMVDAVYWTLQLEVIFYVLAGLILFPRRLDFRSVSRLLWWLLPVFAAFAYWGKLHSDPGLRYASNPTFASPVATDVMLLPLFALGILVYFIYHEAETRRAAAIQIAAYLLMFAVFMSPIRGIFLATMVGLLLFAISGKAKFLEWRPLVFLGAISYPLYIIHENLGFVLIREGYALGLHPYVSILFATAVSILVAWLITAFIDLPLRRKIIQFGLAPAAGLRFQVSGPGPQAPAADMRPSDEASTLEPKT